MAHSGSLTSHWILHLFHGHPPGLWILQLRPRAAGTSSLSLQIIELVAMSCLALNPLVTIKVLPGVPSPLILARCMEFQPCTLSGCPTMNQSMFHLESQAYTEASFVFHRESCTCSMLPGCTLVAMALTHLSTSSFMYVV